VQALPAHRASQIPGQQEGDSMSRLSLAEQLASRRRDKTLAEILKASAWDRYVVMQAVLLYGQSHDTWSANDIRDLLPEQGRGFLGAAINGMRSGEIIRRVRGDEVPSTLPSTHGHGLKVWTLTGRGHRLAAQRYHQTEVRAA
jgi:hypothetical protein